MTDFNPEEFIEPSKPIIKKELSLEERLKLYEKFESTLRDFFDSANFCYEHCFSQEEAVIGWNRRVGYILGPGKEGCCHKENAEFYSFKNITDFFDENMTHEFEEGFEKAQRKNLEKNFIQNGCCKYHTDSGCSIKKFRSPICNAWVCPSYSLFLSDKYNIFYSGSSFYDGSVSSLLMITLDKKVNLDKINKTKKRIEEAIKRIKNHKEGTKYRKKILI